MFTVTYTGPGVYGIPGIGEVLPGQQFAAAPNLLPWLTSKPDIFSVETDTYATLAEKRLGYFGPVSAAFGYGGAGITILRALSLLDYEARVAPHYADSAQWGVVNTTDLPADAAIQIAHRDWLPELDIVHCLPDDLPRAKAKRRVMWTMFESDRVPDGTISGFGNWPELINRGAERLIVPCRHNAEAFANGGVEVPITVVPYGLDTDVWPYMERPERDTFTVVLFGDLTNRKGPFEAVEAFQLAFPNERNVRLVLKTQHGVLGNRMRVIPTFADTRISVVSETWTRAQLKAWLYDADCFIWPSRGEGWGLCPLQAALTGLPLVTTTHTGMAEWYNPLYFYGIKDSGTSESPLGGLWFEPDVEDAAFQLRSVYENRKKALSKAKRGAAYVRKNFSLEAFARRLGSLLTEL